MACADRPAIAPKAAERLGELALQALITPVEQALVAARERGELAYDDVGLIAGGLVGMIESLHSAPAYAFYEPTAPNRRRQEVIVTNRNQPVLRIQPIKPKRTIEEILRTGKVK